MAKTMITMEDKREFTENDRRLEAMYFTLMTVIQGFAKNEDGTLKKINYPIPKEFNKYSHEDLDYFVERYNNEILKKKNINKDFLRELYFKIIDEYDNWMDLKDEYRNIAALWVIGTWCHKEFISYPLLYVNAMRGSGKSRFLNLTSYLCKDGTYIHSNLTEAVAFRTKGTLLIDEFENIGSKEKQTLRELLNSCYKRGSKVYRMKETKSVDGKDYVAQSFEVFRPICIANIWGMDEVLGDRCITIILEKSSDTSKTDLVENFEFDKNIQNLKFAFLSPECSLSSVVSLQKWYVLWNNYVKDRTTLYSNYSNYINYIDKKEVVKNIEFDTFFTKIYNSNITGRNLEIFMPLFIISKLIGDDVLDYTITNASKIVAEKKHDEEIESKDVMLYDFISKFEYSLDFTPIKILTHNFREYTGSTEEWINDKWFGRAMKRLNLITEKRRKSFGIEIIPNVSKAKEKIKMFRPGEPKI